MDNKSIGFIGAGRVARIIIGGLQRSCEKLSILISDTDAESLEKLKSMYQGIRTASNKDAAAQDIVFLAVPYAALSDLTKDVKDVIKENAVVVSLAPKVTIERLSEMLGGFKRIIRMTPNAPSIIGEGYNPVVFSEAIGDADIAYMRELFLCLGKAPESPEDNLEAYSLITAMSPTYLWFQLYELHHIGRTLGLSDQDLKQAISAAVTGAVKTMYESGMSPEGVMDLVPVKPLGADEENIKILYRSRLKAIFDRLKEQAL